MRRSEARKIVYGDWQTPAALAAEVVAALTRAGLAPRAVLEPTCGTGAFLAAAAAAWPDAEILGFDVNPAHVAVARAHARALVADFFQTAWERVVAELPEPLLVLGNPPWVTSAEQGALGSENLPIKENLRGYKGLEARTGRSNFDVSEWMLIRLLDALRGREATLAMLVKAAVARRVLEQLATQGRGLRGELRRFDARRHFGAAVEAVLLVVHVAGMERADRLAWPVFDALDASQPAASLGLVDGVLCCDLDGYARTRHLAGSCEPEWRSGLKHDCAGVMEFVLVADRLTNGDGERVELEEDYVFPLLKGSDLANGRLSPRRAVLVPQRRLGEDTRGLERTAPRTWRYLEAHRAALDARKSSIYWGQPPFAVFGVGDYAFAPWKVATCGLYKRLGFALVGPHGGRPVVLDDTCYFLPFNSELEARRALEALRSEEARAYLEARVFWDAKRPVNKGLLQGLDWRRVGR